MIKYSKYFGRFKLGIYYFITILILRLIYLNFKFLIKGDEKSYALSNNLKK